MAMSDQYHWRDAARTPRFFFIDAYASLPFLLMLLHISKVTFIIAIVTTTFFAILERFKFTIPMFFRWLRVTIAGPIRITYPWWRE